jgi:predicted DNA-binding protein (UPF0251 family)
MVRPRKMRCIRFNPQTTYFKPRGIPLVHLDEVRLNMDEIEAVRLKDVEGMDQTECAKRMRVSQSTLQRILTGARGKIADALIRGKAIRIDRA